MEHDGEAGQAAAHLLQDVEAQLGLGAGLELKGAVAGADGDGQSSRTPVARTNSSTWSGSV